jgi:hypothetical protein
LKIKKHTTAEQRKHEKITAQPKIDIVVRDGIGLEKLARRKTQGVIFSKSKIKKTKNAKKAGQKWSALV